ncbi:hypothetical protein PCL_04779 [Purpureocillium lilacinum]|uniref:Uncharacterized protein n=1 Tax=Purpureocillium lilacinum TaxID=33203 RepID=A0A2U3DWJ9_PURLI|nr:hypothetical protein PCL_04779 [Purpureocillium lilacinum]
MYSTVLSLSLARRRNEQAAWPHGARCPGKPAMSWVRRETLSERDPSDLLRPGPLAGDGAQGDCCRAGVPERRYLCPLHEAMIMLSITQASCPSADLPRGPETPVKEAHLVADGLADWLAGWLAGVAAARLLKLLPGPSEAVVWFMQDIKMRAYSPECGRHLARAWALFLQLLQNKEHCKFKVPLAAALPIAGRIGPVSNELSNIGPLFGRGTTGYEHVTSWRMALLGGELPTELPSRGSLGPPDEAMRAGFCRRPLLVPAFGHTIAAPDQLRLGADAEGGAAATDWAAVRWFPAPRGLRGAKVRRRLRRLHGQRSVRDDAVNKEVALSQQALRALSIAHGTAKRLR